MKTKIKAIIFIIINLIAHTNTYSQPNLANKNILVVLNPQECLSCLSTLRVSSLGRSQSISAIILPEMSKNDIDFLIKKAFGFIPKTKIISSDSIYHIYTPNNNSCLIIEVNKNIIKRISLNVLSEPWNSLNYEKIRFTQNKIRIKENLSTKTKAITTGNKFFIVDYNTNNLYEINASHVLNTNNDTIQTYQRWSSDVVKYSKWYNYYFLDTTGLHKSLAASQILNKIGRQNVQISNISQSTNKDAAILTIQWAHAAYEGANGKDVGIRLRTLFVEVKDNRIINTYAKVREHADSAGFSLSASNIFWTSDTTALVALKPDENQLANHKVMSNKAIAEFSMRNGLVYWKRSVNKVNWPTPQLRDQQIVGDYGILVPDFFYSNPYIFYQAANEIYNINIGDKQHLEPYSDSKNNFDIRFNGKKLLFDFEIKAASQTNNGHIVCILRQGNDYRLIIMDKYLSILLDASIGVFNKNNKSWMIDESGYITYFDPENSTIYKSYIY